VLKARAVLPAALLAVSISACGGSDPEPPDEPPAALLREAAANLPASGEAEIGVDVVLEGDSLLSGPVAVALDGPFALDPAGGLPRFDFEADAEVAGFGLDGAVVSTGDDAFVVFFGENYRVGPERTAELEDSLQAARSEGAALRAGEWVRKPAYDGTEEVGGVDAVRITGTVDPEAVMRDLEGLASALGTPPGAVRSGALSAGPAEAWVALDDRTLRRIRVQLTFEASDGVRARYGVAAGALTLDAEVSDIGAEVTIEPPPGGGFQPIEDLTGRIESLAGLAF
jgi:hypothetical protein